MNLKKRLNSFKYAAKGIGYAVKTQANLKIHLFIFFMVVLFGIYFRLTLAEWMFVTVVSGAVIAAELFNTAIELLTDIASPQFNKNTGRVKDLSAGAVLITAIAAAITGLVIFAPKIVQWIQN